MRYEALWFVLLLGAAAFIRCSASLYVPTSEDVPPGGSLNRLLEGRRIYVEKCGSCHLLHTPRDFTESEWETRLEEMAPRAKITLTEKEIVLQYLRAGVMRSERN